MGTGETVVSELLPAAVVDELLDRWSEPHRHYHSTTHLNSGLIALEELGGGPIERIAFWFHDAIHSNSTPQDETASAELVGALLDGVRSPTEIAEIQRLILLTTHHQPDEGDLPGQRLCDADLSGMGLDWSGYRANIAGIRAELPGLTDEAWRRGRAAFLEKFLERPRLFHTPLGRSRWERRARRNMERELARLT